MNAQELLDKWENDGDESNGMSIAEMQRHHTEFYEIAGVYLPRSSTALQAYRERMKGQITRKLREAAGEYPDETLGQAEAAQEGSDTDEGDGSGKDPETDESPSEDSETESDSPDGGSEGDGDA